MKKRPWSDQYVGLPAVGFRPCWMLVRQVWHEQKRFLLPSYDELDNPQEAVNLGEAGFTPVAQGKETDFDAVLMKEPVKIKGKVFSKLESHIGVVAAPGLVLHVHEGEYSKVTRISELQVSRILRGPWGTQS